MPYLPMDENFADHPKNDVLSDGAFRLHVAGLLFCSKHLTDGLIQAERVPRLMRTFKARALSELVELGRWLPIAIPGDPVQAYEIHDYLDWNPTRETVLQRRKQAAERKARSRERQ